MMAFRGWAITGVPVLLSIGVLQGCLFGGDDQVGAQVLDAERKLVEMGHTMKYTEELTALSPERLNLSLRFFEENNKVAEDKPRKLKENKECGNVVNNTESSSESGYLESVLRMDVCVAICQSSPRCVESWWNLASRKCYFRNSDSITFARQEGSKAWRKCVVRAKLEEFKTMSEAELQLVVGFLDLMENNRKKAELDEKNKQQRAALEETQKQQRAALEETQKQTKEDLDATIEGQEVDLAVDFVAVANSDGADDTVGKTL